MDRAKGGRLEKKGWKVGTVNDLLHLTPEESAYLEVKLALSDRVRKRREQKGLTQVEVAQLLKSSQSRIAKLEAGDPSVSLDLLVRSLIALGATKRELAQAIGSK